MRPAFSKYCFAVSINAFGVWKLSVPMSISGRGRVLSKSWVNPSNPLNNGLCKPNLFQKVGTEGVEMRLVKIMGCFFFVAVEALEMVCSFITFFGGAYVCTEVIAVAKPPCLLKCFVPRGSVN